MRQRLLHCLVTAFVKKWSSSHWFLSVWVSSAFSGRALQFYTFDECNGFSVIGRREVLSLLMQYLFLTFIWCFDAQCMTNWNQPKRKLTVLMQKRFTLSTRLSDSLCCISSTLASPFIFFCAPQMLKKM
jgi:hypothetical protein